MDELNMDVRSFVNAESAPPADNGAANAAATDILLVGASGFLGTYIAAKLLPLCRPNSGRLLCLLRHGGATRFRDGLSRLLLQLGQSDQTAMAAMGDLKSMNDVESAIASVTILEGDFCQPHFGLSDEHHSALQRVRCVVHSAASVSHVAPYSALKAVNTLGPLRTAAYCATHGCRMVFISSVASLPAGPQRPSSEFTPITVEELQMKADDGYGQSKAVCEALIARLCAVHPSLQCVFVRPSAIAPPSNGTVSWGNPTDGVGMLLAACVHDLDASSVIFPAHLHRTLLTVPVDFVAEVIARLSLDTALPFRCGTPLTYNLANHGPDMSAVVQALEELAGTTGRAVRRVNLAAFRDIVAFRFEVSDPAKAFSRQLLLSFEFVQSDERQGGLPDMAATEAYLGAAYTAWPTTSARAFALQALHPKSS